MPRPRRQHGNNNGTVTRSRNANGGGRLATPQSVDQAIKSVCDIMWRGNCAGAL